MSHASTTLLEPLERRCLLSSGPVAVTPHAAPLTPQQQAQINAALIAAFFAGVNSATGTAGLTANQPATSRGADTLTALSSPDWLDQLVSSSSSTTTITTSPDLSAPSITDTSLVAIAPSPLSADAMTVGPSVFNLG